MLNAVGNSGHWDMRLSSSVFRYAEDQRGRAGDFFAGLDLSELTERDVFEGIEHSRMWHRAFERLEQGRIPVVAVGAPRSE
jgi:hypothetical protein